MNTIKEIKNKNEPTALPFFITGGADNIIKIFEHNLYTVAESIQLSPDDAQKIKDEPDNEKKKEILKQILGEAKADKLITQENFDFSDESLDKLVY